MIHRRDLGDIQSSNSLGIFHLCRLQKPLACYVQLVHREDLDVFILVELWYVKRE
jgi:hypothetical protein